MGTPDDLAYTPGNAVRAMKIAPKVREAIAQMLDAIPTNSTVDPYSEALPVQFELDTEIETRKAQRENRPVPESVYDGSKVGVDLVAIALDHPELKTQLTAILTTPGVPPQQVDKLFAQIDEAKKIEEAPFNYFHPIDSVRRFNAAVSQQEQAMDILEKAIQNAVDNAIDRPEPDSPVPLRTAQKPKIGARPASWQRR